MNSVHFQLAYNGKSNAVNIKMTLPFLHSRVHSMQKNRVYYLKK